MDTPLPLVIAGIVGRILMILAIIGIIGMFKHAFSKKKGKNS